MADFTPDEMRRYGRHLVIPQVGPEGQARLRDARVLLVGAGGLGSPLAVYLAAAGVGTLGIVDFDVVDESNLQRQILHATADVGRPKVESAQAHLAAINPLVTVVPHAERLSVENAAALVARYDIVADGSDNFATRYLVNDACVLGGKPLVYGSIFRFDGQATVFNHGDGPCYRCLFPEMPDPDSVPNCAEAGVLGVLPGLVGCIQATEVIKLILGEGDPLAGRLLMIDALTMKFQELRLPRDPGCPICGDAPTITTLREETFACATEEPVSMDLTPTDVNDRLEAGKDFCLLDVREDFERQICAIPGDHLHIPMNTIPDRLAELPKDKELVVYCKMGGRSARVVAYLQQQGFTKAVNMAGGVIGWGTEIDPEMPKY